MRRLRWAVSGHSPLTAVSRTGWTAPDQGGRSGHRADPDLRIRTLPHWLDRLHWSTDQEARFPSRTK